MHFVFMPYGKRDHVEKFLRELESKWYTLRMVKNDQTKDLWLEPQIRILPFGLIDYVFPREHLDMILTSLIREDNRYRIPNTILKILRKVLGLKPIPKYNSDKKMLSCLDSKSVYVNIIPLGVKDDADIIGTKEDDLGWTHEAI